MCQHLPQVARSNECTLKKVLYITSLVLRLPRISKIWMCKQNVLLVCCRGTRTIVGSGGCLKKNRDITVYLHFISISWMHDTRKAAWNHDLPAMATTSPFLSLSPPLWLPNPRMQGNLWIDHEPPENAPSMHACSWLLLMPLCVCLARRKCVTVVI